MEFLWDNIWAILVVVLVLWIINKVLTGGRASGDHFQQEQVTNTKLREMAHGDFTDQELKQLLPGQKVLAVSLVRKKYGLSLREALAYVENIQHGAPDEPLLAMRSVSSGHLSSDAVYGSVSDELREKVKKLKDEGHQIEAIKALKAGVDIDLKSAKDYVDEL